MNTKTIVILFAITVVVLMLTVDEANAQRCRRRCRGGPRDRCVSCGARCPPTCRNPRPRPCGPCIRNVCRCQSGWVRAPNGRCVRPNQCPSQG